MIKDCMHVRRKDRLRVIVDGNCGVGPPEECLRFWRPIIQLHGDFQVSFPWIECEARGHFRAIHAVDFADPDRFAAIGRIFDDIRDGPKRVWAMVLRPVELDAT